MSFAASGSGEDAGQDEGGRVCEEESIKVIRLTILEHSQDVDRSGDPSKGDIMVLHSLLSCPPSGRNPRRITTNDSSK